MKKHWPALLLGVGILLASSTWSFAQKIAYVNSSSLLNEMPEVKQAESELDVLKTQLQKKYELQVKAFQTKVQDFQRKQQSGEMSPKAIQDEEAKLTQEQESIVAQEQQIQDQLVNKRNELLKPIFDKVQAIINELAKANGYMLVLDASPTVLFVDPSVDLTAQVKTKLGLK